MADSDSGMDRGLGGDSTDGIQSMLQRLKANTPLVLVVLGVLLIAAALWYPHFTPDQQAAIGADLATLEERVIEIVDRHLTDRLGGG